MQCILYVMMCKQCEGHSYLDTLPVAVLPPHVLQNWVHGPPVVKLLLKLVGIPWEMSNRRASGTGSAHTTSA